MQTHATAAREHTKRNSTIDTAQHWDIYVRHHSISITQIEMLFQMLAQTIGTVNLSLILLNLPYEAPASQPKHFSYNYIRRIYLKYAVWFM